MSGTNGSGRRYTVGVPERIRDQLRDIADRAVARGQGDRVTAAYAEILTRLRQQPREYGEPMYHLRKMRMMVRNVAVDPLYIEFGVHDDQSQVVIRRVRWLADPAA